MLQNNRNTKIKKCVLMYFSPSPLRGEGAGGSGGRHLNLIYRLGFSASGVHNVTDEWRPELKNKNRCLAVKVVSKWSAEHELKTIAQR